MVAIIEANINIIMNDPLKDNRIFPEEMQQKKPIAKEKKLNLAWLWIVLGVMLLAILVWYGYQSYKNRHQDDLPTLQEQQEIFNALKTHEPISIEERDQKIQDFFNGE